MENKEHVVGAGQLHVMELIPDEQAYENPLVLVHGSFGGFMMWQQIAHALVEKGFHIYALSLRGHKPNEEIDLGKVGMADYVDDIKLVTSELQLKNPVVIGHSMAGLLVLMYAKDNSVSKVVAIDPSASAEVQGTVDPESIAKIPDVYTSMDAGMPQDPMEAMRALPDVPKEVLMKMREMLGQESGKARRDRKKGISIPKGSITAPILFLGAELGKSVPFGISPESTEKMSAYYDGKVIIIKGASHPGMLVGKQSKEVAETISSWLTP